LQITGGDIVGHGIAEDGPGRLCAVEPAHSTDPPITTAQFGLVLDPWWNCGGSRIVSCAPIRDVDGFRNSSGSLGTSAACSTAWSA